MLTQYQQAVSKHRQRIYSFANYSLRAVEDAEDVTQEVFIKLWQHWRKIDHDKLAAWLMRVAHNAVIDHLRRSKNARRVDDYTDVNELEGPADTAGELDKAAFQRQLRKAIKALDDPFRSIVIMRDIQGLSYSEIQQSLDISESQVKVYLHRGRRKLRDNETLKRMFMAWVEPAAGIAAGQQAPARADTE